MMDEAEKRRKLLLFVRTHRLCSNTARRKQTKNDGSSRERHKLLLLVRTHRHYAVILLEMVDGAERKRHCHWHWQLLLVRSERLDGWQTRRETTMNALGGKKETLTIIVGEIRETGRQMTDSQIHRAERERHWPLLLVRSERLEETDDRLAERLQQIYRVERKRHWPLLLVRSERLEETDDRLAERLNEYIGQKERDTDHYCWWDQRDWKRRTTQTRRGLNPALAYLHCGHWQLWPLPWSLCLSHRGCHWSPGCGHWRWSLLSGGQWLIAALAGFQSAWFDLKQGHHVLKSWDNHRAG